MKQQIHWKKTIKKKRLFPFLFIERKEYYSALKSKRLLRVTWTARKSNQTILKEFNTEYSLEGLMLKLKLQYFGHLMWRPDSLEKTLMLGKIEGRRERGWQRVRWWDGITDSVESEQAPGDGEGQKPGLLQSMGSKRLGHDLANEQQQQHSI